MSEATTKEDEHTDEKGDDETEKKGRPWKRWVLGLVVLVVVVIVAVVALGGSSKTKPKGGTLTIGKQQLLPLSVSGKLAAVPGEEVAGKSMVVQSVVKGQGFWVGAGPVNRVYMQYSGQAGLVGSKVNLAGMVRPAPGNTQKTLKLSQLDAAKVTAEGAYVSVTKVSPAQ